MMIIMLGGFMAAADNIRSNGITEGVIWKQLLGFFFPILLGTLFQTLYNTADAIIVGNILGKEALAAVGGGTSTTINLVIGFFTGLASGAMRSSRSPPSATRTRSASSSSPTGS